MGAATSADPQHDFGTRAFELVTAHSLHVADIIANGNVQASMTWHKAVNVLAIKPADSEHLLLLSSPSAHCSGTCVPLLVPLLVVSDAALPVVDCVTALSASLVALPADMVSDVELAERASND